MVERDDLETILARVLEETKRADGTVNLKEIERCTGVSYKRLRKWKDDGYRLLPDRRGRAAGSVKLLGYTDTIDGLLRNGVANSVVIADLIRKDGYAGGLSIVKDYIREHRDLVPLPRVVAVPRPEHVRRWYTEAGDCYQMDWGFVMVEDEEGRLWKCACFVMVCHHCGFRYIEFFPNSMQESLFIGMLHAFSVMGVPKRILTDNMMCFIKRKSPNYHEEFPSIIIPVSRVGKESHLYSTICLFIGDCLSLQSTFPVSTRCP